MVILDAMPHRHVDPRTTPHLWAQVEAGARAPHGGRSLPVSVTYSNHAAFVTGASPERTGIHGNHVWRDDSGWIAAPLHGPGAPTLFDDAHDGGRHSVAVLGDQHLVPQLGTERAGVCWPPGGALPDGVARCPLGYATDAAVLDALAGVDLDAELVVIHLNQPDTAAHLAGPDSPDAMAQYRATDAAYGSVIELLAPRWDQTVLVTLSDHDQEPVTDCEPVDLAGAITDLAGATVVHEGTAALVRCQRARSPSVDVRRALVGVPGVEGADLLAAGHDEVWMAWTDPGRSFGTSTVLARGQHGSPRCRTQLAIVSGGHPQAARRGRAILRTPPSPLAWAPMVRTLLDLPARPVAPV